jgi:hypothetical protein
MLVAVVFTLSGMMVGLFALAFIFLWVQLGLDTDYFKAQH